MTEKKYIIRMEREGKTIQGSPAYCAGKIGVRYSTILDAVEDLQYGIVRRINGWRILYRINNGGIPVEFVPVNETVGSATAPHEDVVAATGMVVENRYILRISKKERNCLMCALCYLPDVCAKHNSLCGENGIFIDLK